MADITLSYKGATISEISANGTKTLKTAGKYCEDDITLQYVKPSVGGSYVGGTIAWNQLVHGYSANTCTASTSDGITTITPSGSANRYAAVNDANTYHTVISGHKYLQMVIIKSDGEHNVGFQNYGSVGATRKTASSSFVLLSEVRDATSSGVNRFQLFSQSNTVYQIKENSFMVFDLTSMFGSTIADYVYTLESGTAGAGIAWLKANGFFNSAYYAYDAGTLKSIETYSTAAKSNNANIIGNFGMNFDLELRGIPKLDANNVLYYDGDTYESDGTVTRNYAIVDFGTLNWAKSSSGNKFYAIIGTPYFKMSPSGIGAICGKYVYDGVGTSATGYYPTNDKAFRLAYTANPMPSSYEVYIHDEAYTDAATFKTAMSGVYLVYELATPTTESV